MQPTIRKTEIAALVLAALSIVPSLSHAGDGLVALQTADASCPDGSGATYVDCGNGTVTDNRTGLVWLKDAECLDANDWYTATEMVAGLSDLQGSDPDDCGLSDGSSPGEWRLPSKAEWAAMVAAASGMSCNPTITNDQGNGCWSHTCNSDGLCAFSGVSSSVHWSTTTLTDTPDWAWALVMSTGSVGISGKPNHFTIWPVRGVSKTGSGVAALQTADPSCANDSGNTYVDWGNGTVTDNRTGLVWLKNANCLDAGSDWHTAIEVVAGLADLPGSHPDDCGLSDGSSPGEWRLPSKAEWAAMVADAVVLGCRPTITDDQGGHCRISCELDGKICSFESVRASFYWASSSSVAFPAAAWGVSLSTGGAGFDTKATTFASFWPVRGGQ